MSLLADAFTFFLQAPQDSREPQASLESPAPQVPLDSLARLDSPAHQVRTYSSTYACTHAQTCCWKPFEVNMSVTFRVQ